MTVVLVGQSAWEALRLFRYRENFAGLHRVSRATPHRPSRIEVEDLVQRYGLTPPLHVAVGERSRDGAKTVRPQFLQTHRLRQDSPSRWLLRIDDDLYASGPEELFLYAAGILPFHELVLFGYELCASYQLLPPGPFDSDELCSFAKREPITSTRRLRTHLESSSGRRNVAIAKRALACIANASASPRESALAAFLAMPRAYGGLGFELPVLNQNVRFRKDSTMGVGRGALRCDIYWPGARLDIEYDSDEWHVGGDRIARDARRRNDLLSMGVTVVVVTREQFNSLAEMDRIARMVAKRLGTRYRPQGGDYFSRRRTLHDALKRPAKVVDLSGFESPK